MRKFKIRIDIKGEVVETDPIIGYDKAIERINNIKKSLYTKLQLIECKTNKVIVSYEK